MAIKHGGGNKGSIMIGMRKSKCRVGFYPPSLWRGAHHDHRSKNIFITLGLVLLLLSMPKPSMGEPVTQTIPLQPGWNAVFLEVAPVSTAPAEVFADVPDLLSVWRWNPNTATVEFVQDPEMPVPAGSRWLVYYPDNPVLTNLHAIQGQTAYLIQRGGESSVNWNVTGEPTMPNLDWKANSFNFVGFHLATGEEPLFGNFFSSSPAHAGQDIYILGDGGGWEKVDYPSSTYMQRGEGFWVYCKGSSQFTGPLTVQLEQGTGLHYGKTLSEQSVLFRNSSAAQMSVSLSLSSLNNAVYYWVFQPAENLAGWMPFPSSLELTIPAGGSQKLRLGVRRTGLAAETAYGANLAVLDGEGVRIFIPVSITGIRFAGLWVGDTTITKVNQPASTSDPDKPAKTGSEFSFRLIVHAEDSGPVRLLNQVIQMWQEGTWKPDPNDLGKLIVDEPGHFVLFTDDALISRYSGAAMRDGRLVGRRVASPAFPSLTSQQGVMSGSAVSNEGLNPSNGNTLSLEIRLAPDDPTNPFRHLYHQDHKKAEQSYEVSRTITLTFNDVDSEGRFITGVPALGWGASEIGGLYQELIKGLHKNDLRIEGTFHLRKASDVGTLTQ
jgi:hypothetical protein